MTQKTMFTTSMNDPLSRIVAKIVYSCKFKTSFLIFQFFSGQPKTKHFHFVREMDVNEFHKFQLHFTSNALEKKLPHAHKKKIASNTAIQRLMD